MKFITDSITSKERKFSGISKTLVTLLFVIFGFVLVISFKSSPKEILKPLPQDPAVQVYFNHELASSYEDPYRHFTRKGDNLEQQIIDAINQAKSSVDLAVMEFRLPKVAEALTLAHKRQVKVRVVLDNKYNKALSDYSPEEIARMNHHDKEAYEELKRYPGDALAILRESGIEIKDDTSGGATKGSGLMHHKFLVVDGKTIIISSGNFTTSDLHGDFNNFDTRGNPNNMVVVHDNAQLAKIFTDEFNYMWQGLFKWHKPQRNPVTIPAGSGTITVHFSPAPKSEDLDLTSNGVITSYMEQAKKSVHMALFVYSAQMISDTLNYVHNQGVEDIKILIDPDFFAQPYSKAYDAMGLCPHSRKKRRFAQVHPWKHPITTVGFPISPKGDRGVHSKMAILDGVLVITGSHNWSNSGNYSNDETLVFVQNTTVAPHYEREFNRLYQTAKVGLSALPHAQPCASSSVNTTEQNPTSTQQEALPMEN
ncbi:phospholipase D-like domain-containing protein [Aetokthonos hydrillicola Thurmond2011]|jgi:phosphatidylserine/phosphatidylglycerophosphate/cardiolipin synthase-like enzyme|uniref:phospholipase D n=1 Tax=Aetokthonos hydrillicola Thurmond2011 TaxID=2712845 RepID=A0AAP5IG53_9CYAN|nr:phospholipase D-like domain-containing protein [Aetokthonos hydrillicola]MBO3459647.1 phosphatidylserine/phosphatidylglycerophosphate/cardiolipin synthase family protein [Aetokthonos hydrillicola CCALA 1050]MBW4589009.1 phosphatidylserine/phosphatidylglycerophosphate/cardiolipin synthase family protein [Aetokthonos hydrillicola CCALA 1050]MDR9900082.1 phospholipase D-like domain-containing protein [Aetokthonos hydrillicola Thurmond2011]